jgi:hypothetical protein
MVERGINEDKLLGKVIMEFSSIAAKEQAG